MSVDPGDLHRISKFKTGEPHFGRSGGNRFDDPDCEFGTCYFGLSLHCAFAETVLHDEVGEDGFDLVAEQLARFHYRFRSDTVPLRLADLTGISLKRLGGTGELSSMVPYDIPQAWAKAVHEHPAVVDGILYQSRHLSDEKSVVVFERAAHKLVTNQFLRVHLLDSEDGAMLRHDFNIRLG